MDAAHLPSFGSAMSSPTLGSSIAVEQPDAWALNRASSFAAPSLTQQSSFPATSAAGGLEPQKSASGAWVEIPRLDSKSSFEIRRQASSGFASACSRTCHVCKKGRRELGNEATNTRYCCVCEIQLPCDQTLWQTKVRQVYLSPAFLISAQLSRKKGEGRLTLRLR